MASDSSEHGPPGLIEEEVESHAPAPTPSREQSSRAELSQGTAGKAQQAFLQQMTQLLRQVTGAIPDLHSHSHSPHTCTATTAPIAITCTQIPTREIVEVWGG